MQPKIPSMAQNFGVHTNFFQSFLIASSWCKQNERNGNPLGGALLDCDRCLVDLLAGENRELANQTRGGCVPLIKRNSAAGRHSAATPMTINECTVLKPYQGLLPPRPAWSHTAQLESISLPGGSVSGNPHLAAVGVDAVDFQVLGRKTLAADDLHADIALLLELH